MDGFSLAERIRSDLSLTSATIMMLTSGGQMGDAARCAELGIAAYLVKPIRQAELLKAICAIVEQMAPPKAAAVKPRAAQELSRSRGRVLVVEDNRVNQRLAVRLLENHGFEVTVAADGREALDELERDPYDLILMDVQMPNMDGLEATAVIRERDKLQHSHTRIIAMTAHAVKGGEEQCLAAGMDAFVSKPIRSEQLFETIDRILGQPI